MRLPPVAAVAPKRQPWRPASDLRRLRASVEPYPELADLTLYLRVGAAAGSDDVGGAAAMAATLRTQYPESIWLGPTLLITGRMQARAGNVDAARDALETARATTTGQRQGLLATLTLAEVELRAGNADRALVLANEVRAARSRGLAARRARRVAERAAAHTPGAEEPRARMADAELRLAEGDAAGAESDAAAVLATNPPPELRDQALWVHARALQGLGRPEDAEAICLRLARGRTGVLGPKALSTAARWRWNADDDAGAARLFRDLLERFPSSEEAPEALYAVARIQQEAGEYAQAAATYATLGERYPSVRLAPEARWRSGWALYLAGDYAGAAQAFDALADTEGRSTRIAAEYWEARALEQLGSDEAPARFEHLAEHHATSYYGTLARARLGRAFEPVDTTRAVPPRPGFPDALTGRHADRARRLAELGHLQLARLEVDALGAEGASPALLIDAYTAVGAPGPAIRLASGGAQGEQRQFAYPLGYWDVVSAEAVGRGLDPFLVAALIRRESLFLPDAISPADAHGLMQLLPRTAAEVAPAAGVAAPDRLALHRVDTNVALGTTLLRRLLDRYGGSQVRALAAYNAGEDAVAKWDRRYGHRPEDEFVELISYRETRDYVKAVLENYEIYRQIYAPSAVTTSDGNPPKAPFDMTTITSPG